MAVPITKVVFWDVFEKRGDVVLLRVVVIVNAIAAVVDFKFKVLVGRIIAVRPEIPALFSILPNFRWGDTDPGHRHRPGHHAPVAGHLAPIIIVAIVIVIVFIPCIDIPQFSIVSIHPHYNFPFLLF